MNQLDAMFQAAQEHQAAGRMNDAIVLYRAIAAGPDYPRAHAAVCAQVRLLMRMFRVPDAQQALASFLGNQFVMPTGDDAQPRVLMLFGLENWDSIMFMNYGDAFPFEINAGHFDVIALLKNQRAAFDAAFVPVELDPGRIPWMHARMREYGAILNVIADPLAEPTTLKNLTQILSGYEGRVFNRPERVAASARDHVAALLGDIPGIVAPRCTVAPALDAQTLADRLASSPEGLIVRPVESQTGTGIALLRDAGEIDKLVAAFHGRAVYLTDYHEFRDPRTGHFTKMRFFHIGGQVFAEHRIVADVWNIHGATRDRLMEQSPELQAEERRFYDNPAEFLGADAWRALEQALARFDLEYVGIDCAQLADGRLLLFEANPAMRVNYAPVPKFPYMQPHIDRIGQAFTRMIERGAGLPDA